MEVQSRLIVSLREQLAALQQANRALSSQRSPIFPEHLCPDYDYDLYGMAGAVSSLTVFSNWSKEKEAHLRAAVEVVVLANPILQGKLVATGSTPQLSVIPGSRLPA